MVVVVVDVVVDVVPAGDLLTRLLLKLGGLVRASKHATQARC